MSRGSTGRDKTAQASARGEFTALVRRLALRARADLVARRASEGLFFGLVPGLLAAVLAGTVTLPFSAPAFACCAAAAGILGGIIAGLIRRIDVRRLLIEADRSLDSRELASTALELVRAPWGKTFSEAVIAEAAGLMNRFTPRRMLGPLRLPLLPFLPVLALLIGLSLLFPFNLRSLFAARPAGTPDLAMIGEDLQSYGRRLQDSALSQGRSLALAQDLAKLGRDLAQGAIRKDEALDRMAEVERRLRAEYDLRLRAFNVPDPRAEGHGPAGGDQAGRNGSGSGRSGKGDGFDSSLPENLDSRDLKDMSDALERLRQGQGSMPPSGGETGESQSMAQGPQSPTRQPGSGQLPPGGNDSQNGQAGPPRGTGSGAAPDSNPDEPAQGAPSGAPGMMPAPDTRGPPSKIAHGGKSSPLKTEAAPAEGDSTKLLVRALPEWSGSRLPEARVLRRYAQAAESALTREEVPPRLKESVKSYFTIIGVH